MTTLLIIGVPMVEGDDIWAATSIVGSVIDNIVFTLRFDLHPPCLLYFFGYVGWDQ